MSVLLSLQPYSPPKPLDMLVWKLLPAGELVLLDGPSGAGKSLLAANIAALVSHSHVSTTPSSVLVIASPDQRELFVEHLTQQQPNYAHVRGIQYEPDPEAAASTAGLAMHVLKFIQNNIVEHKPNLLIIDSLEELIDLGAEPNTRTLYELWHTLRDLAHENRCTILIPRQNGMHENRQYGPFTRLGSETARLAFTILWHPTDPAMRIITRAKNLRGLTGDQFHLQILDQQQAYLEWVDPHQHVRPSRSTATWLPDPLHAREDHDIIRLVEFYLQSGKKKYNDVQNYVTGARFTLPAFHRAMARSKIRYECIAKTWYCFPTEQMMARYELDKLEQSAHREMEVTRQKALQNVTRAPGSDTRELSVVNTPPTRPATPQRARQTG